MYDGSLILRKNRYLVSVMFLRPKCLFKKVIALSLCALQARAQGNATFFQFFVRARADLVYVARQGCATSRLIHEPCSTESQVVLIFWHPLVH